MRHLLTLTRHTSVLLVLLLTSSASSAHGPEDEPRVVKAWVALLQGIAQLEKYVQTGELSGIHSEDVPMGIAVSVLIQDVEPLRPDVIEEAKVAILAFVRRVSDLHAAADAFDRQKTEDVWREVAADFQSVMRYYGSEVLAPARALAERHTCPMHPELTGRSTDRCSKCGMDLDQPVRIPLHSFGGTPARQTVSATIRTTAPLQPGQSVEGTLALTALGRPILDTDLRVVHTQKIHLLIIDQSLTDYHHVHPETTQNPGEYRFTLVPRKPGPYRAWADVRPTYTGLQEYAMTDVHSQQAGAVIEKGPPTLRSEVGGLRFDLVLDAPGIKVGQPTKAAVRISDLEGRPFTGLEPIMGSFAHIVGFADDYKTVLHTHPNTRGPLSDGARGGPELEFQLYPTQAGFYRLFVQVQVRDASVFAPFNLHVLPAP